MLRRARTQDVTCRSRPARTASRGAAVALPARVPRFPSAASSSRSRPTIGARVSGRSAASASASTASQRASGSALPFATTRLGVAVVDRPCGSRGYVSSPTITASGRRGALQARRGVDDVAGDHRLALLRARVERHDRLAGVDRDARRRCRSVASRPVADGERRAHRPLGIVSVRDGRAEQAHHRVADELLDRAAEPLDLGPAARSTASRKARTSSGSSCSESRREADEVDEEHGDDAPLLAGPPSLGEGRAAGQAKTRSGGVLLIAARTRRHAESVVGRPGRATLDQ